MVALLDVGVVAIAVRKKTTPTLSSATIRVRNFKKLRRFWLAEVEKLSPCFVKPVCICEHTNAMTSNIDVIRPW